MMPNEACALKDELQAVCLVSSWEATGAGTSCVIRNRARSCEKRSAAAVHRGRSAGAPLREMGKQRQKGKAGTAKRKFSKKSQNGKSGLARGAKKTVAKTQRQNKALALTAGALGLLASMCKLVGGKASKKLIKSAKKAGGLTKIV